MRRCATCWDGAGDIESQWLCDKCKGDPANADWATSSRLEATGFHMDDFEAGSSIDLRPRRDPYATKLAIEIMAMHCAGKSNRAISRALDCALGHVNRTVSYWKQERGEKLAIIKTLTKMKIKKSH